MKLGKHLKLLASATAVWLGVWIAGLPDYFQQYSTRALIAFEVVLLGPVGLAGFLALRKRRAPRTKQAALLSVYFSLPLFVYDLFYCGWYLGHGLRFLATYWYLTTYYFVPAILFMPTAWWLDRRNGR